MAFEFIPRSTQLTVGASVVEVSPEMGNDFQRSTLVLTNVSTAGQLISISWGKDAVTGQGVVLYPGGSWQESYDVIFRPLNLRITAIADAAGGLLAVHERGVPIANTA